MNKRLLVVFALCASVLPFTRNVTAQITGCGTGRAPIAYGRHLYCPAGVGNSAEVSIAASPDGTVLTSAGTQGFVLVANPRPADWTYRSTNGGRTWSPIAAPLPGAYNEGDVAWGPSGRWYSTWFDLAHHSARAFVSDDGVNWTESLFHGPQPFADRPWVMAAPSTVAGAPELAISEAGSLFNIWGSADAGESYIVFPRGSGPLSDPPIVPTTWMDHAATNWGSNGAGWTPLPAGGFLNTENAAWTGDMQTWNSLELTSPLRELSQSSFYKIASSGVIYQARFEGNPNDVANYGKVVQYRFLKDGAWSPWRTVATFPTVGRYTQSVTGGTDVDMVINTHGNLLGINTRDGTRDVLIRIDNADTPSPVVDLEYIGLGCDPGGATSTARYDYPTLVFDAGGRAITSFCDDQDTRLTGRGEGFTRIAYEQ